MAAPFDKLLFLISTDCFTEELFGEFSQSDIEKMKQAAREVVLEMLDGENDYFRYTDYSPERKEKTQRDFFTKLQALQSGAGIQQKIQLFYETLCGISADLSFATSQISTIAARLYWLNTDSLETPISDELLELVTVIEPLGLDRESHGFEWGDIWLNSPSKWDQFVMSVLDDVPEVPYLTFTDITRFSSELDFLYTWKKHLDEERFAVIKDFILKEAHTRLSHDPDVLLEIDKIMATL